MIELFYFLGMATMSQGVGPEEPWIETLAIEWGLDEPEDVHFPEGSPVGFVSNIKGESAALDGNGYISRIDAEGAIVERRWISGLNGPKGMRDDGRHLYVADIDAVVQIEMESARIVGRFEAPDAGMLNDIAIGPDRTLYVSDSSRDMIWRMAVDDEALEVWAQADTNLTTVNGLYAASEGLFAVSTSTGVLSLIDYDTARVREVVGGLGMADGIERLDSGSLLVSDLTGRMHLVDSEGRASILFINRETSANNDFGVVQKKRVIVMAHRADGALSWRSLPETVE